MAPRIEEMRPLGWKKPSSSSHPNSRYAPNPPMNDPATPSSMVCHQVIGSSPLTSSRAA